MNQFEKLGFALAKSADNNRWLNDFDRNRYIFGSGIKRWLNQPGGFFGPPAVHRVAAHGGIPVGRTTTSPAGSRWVAHQAGLSPFHSIWTHEEANTRPALWLKAPTPRTPTAIGRMLGATQGLSTPATAKRIKKMQKPVPPVIRYPSSRPRSPAPVPATAKRIKKLGLD